MKQIMSPMEQINWIGKLADLKTSHAESLHLLHALIELLIDKQLITKEELISAVQKLDTVPITKKTSRPTT